ncbi:hypothetical protein ABQZ99_021045 (plasmid) [Xanthomonas hortorum pv. vitians]|uniref:hypothetical protein n=1 Tax=Xanthomonas hortorum TaxID=56454 RepID=UPI0009388406|nr:hypothetical protein BI317_25655 [Xanthomonas hortorum pv. gardneri]ASW48725.1 hypothetical protein XJ27_22110 [Xanthomonas hortorum]
MTHAFPNRLSISLLALHRPRWPCLVGLIYKDRDTWMTQAEFMRPNRRVVNLLRIGLLFADIDTYRQPWAAGVILRRQLHGMSGVGCTGGFQRGV